MRHIDVIARDLRDQLDRYPDSRSGVFDPWRDVVLASQAAAADFAAEDEQAMTTRSELWITARNNTGTALLTYNAPEGHWEIYARTYPHCPACGCRIPPADLDVVPETDTDPKWHALAVYHGVRCPWILTRAGRRHRPDPAQLAAELDLTLKLLYHSHAGISGADGSLADHLQGPIPEGHGLPKSELHRDPAGQHGLHDGLHGRTWATSPAAGAPDHEHAAIPQAAGARDDSWHQPTRRRPGLRGPAADRLHRLRHDDPDLRPVHPTPDARRRRRPNLPVLPHLRTVPGA